MLVAVKTKHRLIIQDLQTLSLHFTFVGFKHELQIILVETSNPVFLEKNHILV